MAAMNDLVAEPLVSFSGPSLPFVLIYLLYRLW